MTNRSDRRALTLILPKVFSETVDLMRRARANFHRGPEEQFFHEEAESMTATIVLNPGKNLLHFSGGTIYDNNSDIMTGSVGVGDDQVLGSVLIRCGISCLLLLF